MSHLSNGTTHQSTTSDTDDHSDSENPSNSSLSSFEEETNDPSKTNGTDHVEPVYIESKETYQDSNQAPSSSVTALLQIPLFCDSLNYVKDSKYGGMAVNYAGVPIINTVSKITSPFQSQINQIDGLAATSIKSIGEKVPVILTPTNDIIEKVKNPAIQTIDNGKQYISNVASNVSEGIDQRLAQPAKSLAQSVQAQITPIAKNVDNSFEPLVTKYTSIVDRLLPEDELSEKEEEKSEDSVQLSQTHRAFNTTAKAHRRFSRNVKRTLVNTQSYTSEQLNQYTVVVKATETINQLNAKLHEVFILTRDAYQNPDFATTVHGRLHDIAGWFVGELDREKDLPKALKERANEFAQSLIATRDSIAKYIKENATHVPEEITKRVHPLFDFFNQRFPGIIEQINNNNTWFIGKARDFAEQTIPTVKAKVLGVN